ncbi:alkaline phosphatase family protein [Bifidobacterium magnum]|uniref:Type I phosphodiesterase/nucleotide pyrophosphatase n=1 Tax=Bifidobacterium magnum TaxID=1692 RepID=A0A087BC93_9BIFI|nr:alkaline phosphatase family protein [Bifidobacterium magnum]KFI68643.1 Type I phosphodiesterase/nucleotide pyrophosphatase [Bifidobacterium magnum]
MGRMIELPSMHELLSFVPTATYGDSAAPTVLPGQAVPEGLPCATTQARGGALHLSSVLPAVSSALGTPVATAIHQKPQALQEALGIPDARSAVVVLVDGLGYWNLQEFTGHAPYLRSLLKNSVNQRPISTCSPSTTVAAMGTFGTGTCPGLTGMTGYTQYNPEQDSIAQLIQFKNALDPLDLQRQPTIFEQLAEQDVRATSVGLYKFAHSPMTKAALRGSNYISDERPNQRVKKAALAAKEPGLTYLYLRDVDKNGHASGWGSEPWVEALEKADAQLGLLRRSVPQGTLIVIVADHGMVAAEGGMRIDIAKEPQLAQGVRLVGGEPRCVSLYAQPGEDAQDIAQRWRDRLGDKAWIRTCQELVDSGFYGPVDPRIMPVIGDVVACAAGNVTLVDSRTQTEMAMSLPGVHGSQTMLEMDIPCLIDVA